MELSSDAVAAIVGATCGALAGSVLTAWFSSKQLARQLDHQRESDDLGELRSILDEVVVAAEDAKKKARRILVLFMDGDDEEEDWEYESLEEATQDFRTQLQSELSDWKDFHQGPPAVEEALMRLVLRLGRDDPLTLAYAGIHGVLSDFLETTPDGDPIVLLEPEERRAAFEKLEPAYHLITDAQFAFLDLATERAGVMLP